MVSSLAEAEVSLQFNNDYLLIIGNYIQIELSIIAVTRTHCNATLSFQLIITLSLHL